MPDDDQVIAVADRLDDDVGVVRPGGRGILAGQVYGDRVVEVEYTDNPRSAYTEACRARGAAISVVLRDRDVVPRGRSGYVDEAC